MCARHLLTLLSLRASLQGEEHVPPGWRRLERTLGKGGELEDAGGAVPDDGLGISQRVLDQLDGVRPNIQTLEPTHICVRRPPPTPYKLAAVK